MHDNERGKEDMIKLHDKNTQELIGEINEKQLQFLIDELVEEDSTDQDYYINRDQLDQLEKKGGDETLIQMLRDALGTKDDMDIIWTKS
jgi:processive 1,2-diacylglycerol beta-glucosyltransferase